MIKMACLPVGREWEPSAQEQFDRLLAGLPECVLPEHFSPALDEPAILDQAESIAASRPALLLLAAMHGASARALVLAARKSSVPTAIWCHDERHSLASSALAAEALRQLGHPHLLIHGAEPTAIQELTTAAAAAEARQRLSCARIGQLGPLHFNLISASVNPLVLQRCFGAWIVPLSLSNLRLRLSQMDSGRIAAEAERLRAHYCVEVADEPFEKAVALHLVFEDIAGQQRLDTIAVDCWNEIMPEFGVSPCLGFSGDDYRIACEGDVVLATTMIAGEGICGQPGFAGDFYSFDEQNAVATFMHCGGCAALHAGSGPMKIVAQAPPGPVGQPGVVVACCPQLQVGPGTVVLLHGASLEQLHLRRCEILRTEFRQQMETYVRIEGDGAAFRREAAGNHYIVFPGDCYDAWKLWAEWAGIVVH